MPVSYTLTVELGERSYPIHIGSGLLDAGFDLSDYVAGPDCLIVSNTTVGPLYAEKLLGALKGKHVRVIELPDGEAYKTLKTVQAVLGPPDRNWCRSRFFHHCTRWRCRWRRSRVRGGLLHAWR